MIGNYFWLLLTLACIVWYSVVTVYVGIRGAMDIKSMLARLSALQKDPEPTPPNEDIAKK
ncbi:MAG: hypothetical protein M1608_14580 [Candidatus Omnitrophica bacterium]|nr:hypothetical protein [Candidatus Omnitrophota bacterium]